MIQQLAIDAVMVLPPGQAARCDTADGFAHWRGAARELKRVATNEVTGWIGFVELLAPHACHRTTAAVYLVFDVAEDLRPRVQHQILADEAAGIGKPVGKPRRRR